MTLKPIVFFALLLSFAIPFIMAEDVSAQVDSVQSNSAQIDSVQADSVHFYRLGDEISILEKQYFGLFPNIKNFASASISQNPFIRTTFIEINTLEGVDTLLTIDWEQTKALEQYTEHFEQYLTEFRKKKKEFKEMSLLRGLILPRQTFSMKGIELVVQTYVHSKPQTGQLLYATEDFLILTNDSAHVALSEPGRALFIHAEDIKHFTIPKGFLGRLINDFDIPVGGSKTIYQSEVLPYIKQDAMAYIMPSPDLEEHLFMERNNPQPDTHKEDKEYIRNTYDRFQLSISHTTFARNTVPTHIRGFLGFSESIKPRINFFNLNAGLAFRLKPSVKLGLRLHYMLKPTLSNETNDESLSGFQLDISAAYVFQDILNFGFAQDISVGAGFSLARLTSQTHLIAIFPGNSYSENYQQTSFAFGGHVTAAYDFYITNNLAVSLGMGSTVYPFFSKEQRVLKNRLETHTLREVKNNDSPIIQLNLFSALKLDF